MQAQEMTVQATALAKIIKWAFENKIEITVRCHKEPGIRDQIEIELSKAGKKELIRIYDWDEFDTRWLQKLVEEKASNLSLTRLVL